MLKQAKSIVEKCSSLFLSSTSFFKGNAMNTRKRTTTVLTLVAVTMAMLAVVPDSTQAATITVLDENFDASTSLPAGWSEVSVVGEVIIVADTAYSVSDDNTLWIGTRDSNVVTTPALGLVGATEATISFQWTTLGDNSSAFGRIPQIQYSSDGSVFATIGSFTVPATTTVIPPHTLFTTTITTGGGYSFTADSVFRIVGDNNSGGSGAPLIVDNFLVTSNPTPASAPEPSTLILAALGLMGMMGTRRRRR